MSALELTRVYTRAKKERLKMVYRYEHELNKLRSKIDAGYRELSRMEAQACYDRENGIDETTLFIN